MTLKITTILCLASAILSAAATRYYFPSLKTETLTVDHDIIHNNIVTVTKTIKEPNGETNTTTTTTDTSSKVDITSHESITVKQPQWTVSGLVANDFSRGLLVPTYGAQVQRQILGPINIGAFGLTNGTIGVSVGISF